MGKFPQKDAGRGQLRAEGSEDPWTLVWNVHWLVVPRRKRMCPVFVRLAILGLGLWSLLARLRKRLYDWRWLHRGAIALGPAGFVAVIAGWVTTEVGRQPYTIYGFLLTSESHSPLAAPAVATSLIAFVLVYFVAFGAGTYYILRLMASPPGAQESEPPSVPQHAAGITPALAVGAPVPGAD